MVVAADDPTPTVLGMLILSHRVRDFLPGAYLQFLRIDGTTLADPILDEELIDGTVDQLLRLADEKCMAHNRTQVDFTSAPREQRSQSYPLVALQQLIRNAVLHRTYETSHAPVRLYWFNDRIVINSPGGAYGVVTPENFGQPGITDYRNPNLAEALRILGYVQRFGAGILLAQQALRKNGNPPLAFRVEPGFVEVTLRVAP
ncbi:MAG: hypothetical protein EI684_14850 [Candidatus Viridilinea halotolerans]|uniref:Uncharacterized protein n=1 Tax=Candidatus Viridilinea halotolerans TaxID=2491704 RepID=A0A426TW65_9CHLR|nr:MAG: hypothetical protein EI684_14850 [Candidatus Viridilinea halotolerans]